MKLPETPQEFCVWKLTYPDEAMEDVLLRHYKQHGFSISKRNRLVDRVIVEFIEQCINRHQEAVRGTKPPGKAAHLVYVYNCLIAGFILPQQDHSENHDWNKEIHSMVKGYINEPT